MTQTRPPKTSEAPASQSVAPKSRKTARIAFFDVARGVALIAMAIYHFVWDLDFFGYIAPGTAVQPGWHLFARAIAVSFLILVGISLYLAHHRGVKWRKFNKRFAYILAAALAITMATLLATPDQFIYFGILHLIALGSLVGLAFLPMGLVPLGICTLIVIAFPFVNSGGFFDYPVLWWTGLSSTIRPTSDFAPFFPMFGAILGGIFIAKALDRYGFMPLVESLISAGRRPVLEFIGRHSLTFYLLHQPILMGLIWSFSQIVPPPPPDYAAALSRSCNAECVAYRDEALCQRYCSCLVDDVGAAGLLPEIYTPAPQSQRQLEIIANQCLIRSEDKP